MGLRHWYRGVAISAVLVGQLALSLPAAAAGKTVKIGMILALSGPGASLGESMSRGSDLYVKLHKKDLPAGIDLQIITRDDASSAATTKRIAQELAVRDHVNLLTGITLSPQGFSVASVATQAKLPTVLMNATTGSITRSSPYLVRFSHSNWQMAYTIGIWAAKHGIKNAYTLAADYAAGVDMEEAFKRGFTDNGGKILGSDRAPISTTDYLPYMQRVKAAAPQSLFIFTIPGPATVATLKAFGDAGLREAGVQLLGTGDIVPPDELPDTGAAAQGMVDASIYTTTLPNPANQNFLKAWHAAYGAKALPDVQALAAWNAMAAIFGVIRKYGADFTSAQAMDVLSHWSTADSPQGPISIDPQTRDIVQNVYLCKVEKVGDHYENVVTDTIPNVKDPWKVLNPAK